MQQHPIDFVIPWVDPSDPQWQEDFKKYAVDPMAADARFERYRDWGLLKFWFRGVEKFSPWVNKIHFITYGHVPEWLDVNHQKINIVRHEDYIPKEFLPVFSSHPIELFMNRIEGLAEHFVYFNDDFYITNKISESDFFVNDLPCDMAIQNVISGSDRMMMSIQANNLSVLNKKFNKRKLLKNNFFKWFNFRYPISYLLRSIILYPWPTFSGFLEPHLPQPFLKTTLNKVWEENRELLNNTMKSKFRSQTDVNQYLFKNWQLCSGNFFPKNIIKNEKYHQLTDNTIDIVVASIKNKKNKIVVVNDGEIHDVDSAMFELNRAFDNILSDKSTFEK